MSNNLRIRPVGFWTFNSSVSPSEFETIDAQLAGSIAGSGGTYAPSSVLTIGGSGLTVSGPLNASDGQVIDVKSSLTISLGATLQLTGNQVVNSGAIVGFTGGSFLTLSSGSTFTMNSGSTASIAATTTMSGALTYSNAAGISMTGTQPVPTASPGVNAVHATSQSKAWANIATDGLGGITLNGGFNVASVNIVSTSIVIHFAEPLADTDYSVQANGFDGVPRFYPVANGGLFTSTVTIDVKNVAGSTVDPASSVIKMMVDVKGRQ